MLRQEYYLVIEVAQRTAVLMSYFFSWQWGHLHKSTHDEKIKPHTTTHSKWGHRRNTSNKKGMEEHICCLSTQRGCGDIAN